jgi:ribosomal protein S18 acetylase RimI-like enzyme
MLTYAAPTAEQYDQSLKMMWDDGQEYWENTLRLMQMTWEQYAQIFRTLGEVQAIYQDDQLAGFYWTELREHTLHLHGLILKPEFRGQGIGTAVLNKLSQSSSGKVARIELGVYQGNTGAIRLYQRMGFTITRTLDDLHFYIMQVPLNPPGGIEPEHVT